MKMSHKPSTQMIPVDDNSIESTKQSKSYFSIFLSLLESFSNSDVFIIFSRKIFLFMSVLLILTYRSII